MRSLIFIILVAVVSHAADVPDRYVVTIRIAQKHFTLDPWQHVKDAANAITIEVPVDQQFYNDVSAGSVLNNKFRSASLLLSGSWGNWKVTVADKRKVVGAAAKTAESPVSSPNSGSPK